MVCSCCHRLSREEEKERKKKIKYEQKKTDKIQRKSPLFTIDLVTSAVCFWFLSL